MTAPGFTGAADARVTLTGEITPVTDPEEAKAARERLAKHPDAFWCDFGDFSWHRMDAVAGARSSGFRGAGAVGGEERAGAPDPVAGFSGPIAGHMNADHADSIVAMTKHFVGLTVEEAKIANIDALGMNLAVKRDGETFKIRLPFEPGPATDRKAVKDAMVGMTKTAMKAAAGEKAEKETAQTE